MNNQKQDESNKQHLPFICFKFCS